MHKKRRKGYCDAANAMREEDDERLCDAKMRMSIIIRRKIWCVAKEDLCGAS
jgi:hypothetical protein